MNKSEAVAFLYKYASRKHLRITSMGRGIDDWEQAVNVCKKWVDHRYVDEHGSNVFHPWGKIDDSIPCTCGVSEHMNLVEEAIKEIQ